MHFAYEGGQVRLLLSLISYLRSGEYRSRYSGVKIPRTNLKPDYPELSAAFVRGLVRSAGGST